MIRRVDENWAEGMLGDKIGIFPISYVEVSEMFQVLTTGVSLICPGKHFTSGKRLENAEYVSAIFFVVALLDILQNVHINALPFCFTHENGHNIFHQSTKHAIRLTGH